MNVYPQYLPQAAYYTNPAAQEIAYLNMAQMAQQNYPQIQQVPQVSRKKQKNYNMNDQ